MRIQADGKARREGLKGPAHATGECMSCTTVVLITHHLQCHSMWLACRCLPYARFAMQFLCAVPGVCTALSCRPVQHTHHSKLRQEYRVLLFSNNGPSAQVEKLMPTAKHEHRDRSRYLSRCGMHGREPLLVCDPVQCRVFPPINLLCRPHS